MKMVIELEMYLEPERRTHNMLYPFLPMEKAVKLKERMITWLFLKRWQKSDVSW